MYKIELNLLSPLSKAIRRNHQDKKLNMNKSNLKFRDIDEYHSSCPKEMQIVLEQLRGAIKSAAPKAREIISYGMPAFQQNKVLVYYALNKNHIGFYPTPNPIVHFKAELAKYQTSKGAIQFPIDIPLPLALIKKIVKFRVDEDSLQPPVKTKKSLPPIDILSYNDLQTSGNKSICNLLAQTFSKHLRYTECKIWHGHPVWFIDGNPIVGYSIQKKGVRLMFWSGAGFEEDKLNVQGEKFKDASIFYNHISEIGTNDLKRWLAKSEKIQWDYKNLIKRKGKLERLK